MDRMTPKQVRASERASLSRALRGLMHDLDITQDCLGMYCGISQQKVAQWCNPDSSQVPGISDVRQMPQELARELIDWVAKPHHITTVDTLDPSETTGYFHALNLSLSEGGQAHGMLAEALSDGHLSDMERANLIREFSESIRAQMNILHALEGGDEVRQ